MNWTVAQIHRRLVHLDYGTDEETWGNKKPWRYRWPDSVQDEVLARLLAPNQQRHAEEAAPHAKPGEKPPAKTKKPGASAKPAESVPAEAERSSLFAAKPETDP